VLTKTKVNPRIFVAAISMQRKVNSVYYIDSRMLIIFKF
jgi:hypothetical protein